ncbi:bifunctional diguanylate cyclase/phosphodiesterase [Phytohalomonas tamaricis]|uniref:bifunctional diguanylate cyclase/phosphodiesterase n=1 Tax=Phytohalomonas tamaricis TaxID=2081032 RepID=UPI000D0B5FCF|nr:EAL domain-containing protein [Phytohalomonas tamaricis]
MISFPIFSSKDKPLSSYAEVTRRSVIGFTALVLCLFLIASTALVYIARTINERQIAHSEADARKVMEIRQKTTGITLTDYAFWNDAYLNTKDRIDTNWAYENDNIGSWLFSDYGYEGVFIIGPAQETRYAVTNGVLSQQDASQWIAGDLAQLLRQARNEAADDSYAQGYFMVNGTPAIVSAAAIKPDEAVPVDTLSILVFVDILTPAKLHTIANDFGLHNLHIDLTDNADQFAPAITLQTNPGIRLTLRWDADNPGNALLHVFLPLLLLVGMIFAVAIWWLQRSTLRVAMLTDITFERLQANREALRKSEERFRDVAESASDWIWETNAQQELTYLSERFCSATGYDAAIWLGRPLHSLLDYDQDSFDTFAEGITSKVMADSAVARMPLECQLIDHQGRQRFCSLFVRMIMSGDVLTGYRGTVCDITEEVEAKAHVAYLSQHDALTGVPNRSYLYSFLQSKLDAGPTPDNFVVVISLDLDRFKPINDTLGHAAGDQVLSEVAERLQKCLRQNDLVARLGGDEFVIVACNLSGQHLVDKLCARLLKSIGQAFIVGEHELHIGTSIGIAVAPSDGNQAKELLRYADIALYEAKAAGRNTWLFYTMGMNERILERRQLEADLRQALRNDELFLEFQPRYDLEHNHITGAEALVRWAHPQLGYLCPAQFIPVAEETGLIVPLSDWVLQQACAEAASWDMGTFISVNLSPVEFLHGDLVSRVRRALENTGLAAARLELEITENVMLEEAETALTLMHQLKALGVRLSMDDFGTGYSSLSYLRNYPFDGIKIDRSFTADLNRTQDGQAIIEAILGLGRALSMTVTAEGVETLEQLNELTQMKCLHAQGYHLGRPMQAEVLRALMNGSAIEIASPANSAINETTQ